ncbi:hypothetical protein [Flavobacterium sp. '19STA2R22 D10 B1']|uniref:hypothetical protein n=1 Tax=Flavobacterium aerium TaxID=3037261 RepID=UPI00278BBE52|nr:hypothetical protein [Flavobacterium sp. '19STA2R22 D10 B1']
MKNIYIFVLLLFCFACSSESEEDRCEVKKREINREYDQKVNEVLLNPGPEGVYDLLLKINTERNKKLAEVCP